MHYRDGWMGEGVGGRKEWIDIRTEECIAKPGITGWQIWAHNSEKGSTNTPAREKPEVTAQECSPRVSARRSGCGLRPASCQRPPGSDKARGSHWLQAASRLAAPTTHSQSVH